MTEIDQLLALADEVNTTYLQYIQKKDEFTKLDLKLSRKVSIEDYKLYQNALDRKMNAFIENNLDDLIDLG